MLLLSKLTAYWKGLPREISKRFFLLSKSENPAKCPAENYMQNSIIIPLLINKGK